jgi:hypothetical protein
MKKSLWQKFKDGLFTKAQFVVGAGIFALIGSAVLYAYDVLNIAPFVSNTVISATTMNNAFLEVNNKIKKFNNKFMVGISSNVLIPLPLDTSSVATDIFNTVIYDGSGNSYASELVNNNSFIIQESGLYKVMIMGQASSTNFSPQLQVRKFPSSSLASAWGLYSFGTAIPQFNEQTHYLSSGDVVYVNLYHWDSNATGNIELISGRTKLIFEKLD